MGVNNKIYNLGVSMSQVNSAISEATSQLATGYTPKGPASVSTLNGLTGQENGELYTMTDAGTLTDGSLAVTAGDTVAWDAANSVWYKAMDYAPSQYGTNKINNLPTSITAFRTGDVIPVDGPSGTAKMSKDDLLRETAKNALAGNVATQFDPTRTSDNPYIAGKDVVEYKGKLYIFKNDHYGAWSSSDVIALPVVSVKDSQTALRVVPKTTLASSSATQSFSDDYDLLENIPVKEGDVVNINVGKIGCYVLIVQENGTSVDYFSFVTNVERTFKVTKVSNKIPKYINVPVSRSERDSAFIRINGSLVFSGKGNGLVDVVSNQLVGGQVQNLYFVGNDNTYTSKIFFNKFVGGHKYRAYLLGSNYQDTGSDSSIYKLACRVVNADGSDGSILFRCYQGSVVADHYDFTMPENTYGVRFGGRATLGSIVSMKVVDLSIPEYLDPEMGKTSRLVLSKALINSSVSSGYPTYNSSTTRVCCEDIVIFPKTTAKYKYFAPEGLQFSMEMFKASQSGVGGAAIGWKSNGYEFTHTAEEANNCYAYRISFRHSDDSTITADEVLNLINAGKVYFEIEGEVDLDYTKSENCTAVESARKKLITSSPWCKNLPLIAHVSDLHGDITRMRNARKISDLFGASALVNSGDSVMYYGKGKCDFLKEYSDENKPLVFCIGNHESYLTGSQTLYEDFIQSLVPLNGYKKNASDPADNCYYFRDLATEKIRFITLNYYNGGVYAGSLGQAQLEWFVSTLASTPEGYGVIVVVHSPEDRVECPEALQTFWQKERVVTFQEDGFYIGNRPIMKIIDGFISKSSGTESYTNSTDGDVSVAYDFTSLNTGVEFICYMTGHRHDDWVGYYTRSENKQLSLGITCGNALNSMFQNTAWSNESDLGRGDGSGPSQDAVNIYAIDRDKGEIRIVRIGANITTSLEERNVLTIPYRD